MTDEQSTAPDGGVDELVRIVQTHSNPPTVSSPSSPTRIYASPLMGTSARAAKRRMDSDSGPIRIDGTDTYNQQLQHHYQNVRQILDDQQSSITSNLDTSTDSRQSFSAKRDFFEQRFKTPPPTYDAPPRQKVVTTTTTTTSTSVAPSSNVQDRTSSSSNESPSVDRVLEQAVELQKLSNLSSMKSEAQAPFIIERTEQYQVFLDSANHEVRRTPSISRTSIIPVAKTGHATDLDQAQAQAERLTDDHHAIQSLTRALHEHNVTTVNELKRLPSQTNPPASSPSILLDRTNLPVKSDYSVIDALLNNPIGSIDDRLNHLLNLRSNEILANLRHPEYLSSIKQAAKESPKSPETKKAKEKKSPDKKAKGKPSVTTAPAEQASTVPLVSTAESLPVHTTEPITTTTLSEQIPLIDPKEKKKQEKENKKQLKSKSKPKSSNGDYQVLDALIGSPVSLRLPSSYLTKYNAPTPLAQSSSLPSTPPPVTSSTDVTAPKPSAVAAPVSSPKGTKSKSKDDKTSANKKNETLFHLTKIVNDLKNHHVEALASLQNAPPTLPNEPVITPSKPSESLVSKAISPPVSVAPSKANETLPPSESTQPPILYRYMDEDGNILKISTTAPSQLREQPAQLNSHRNTEPPYFYGRHIAIDDDRRHPVSQYEQRATWQGEPKLPTTVTREDFESRDKRVPHLIEQSIPASRTVPVSVDHERSSRTSPSQRQQQQQPPPPPRTSHYPQQQNVKLAWLPLTYPPDPYYLPNGAAGYETDSTISERSNTYRPFDYAPNESYYRYSARPLQNEYYNRSPGPVYYPPPPPLLSHGGRGISPDYAGSGASRNYIEVFRGGDFRESKPSEIYSLPFNEHIRTSPLLPASNRHSRFDQYQSERYGSLANTHPFPPNTSSSVQQLYYNTSTLPNPRYQSNLPPSSVHTSIYHTHRQPHAHRTVQTAPDVDYSNYVRPSKSFDYRPLRSKLQREYKITPNLLVDEWDYPPSSSETTKYSTATTITTTNRSGLSSPDDVFISNPTNKA